MKASLAQLLNQRETHQRARDAILPGTNPARVRSLNQSIGALTVKIEEARKQAKAIPVSTLANGYGNP